MVKQEISSRMINHPHDDQNQFQTRNPTLITKTIEPPDHDRGPTQGNVIRTGSIPNSDVDHQKSRDHNNSDYNKHVTKKLKIDQQTGLTREMNASNVTINNSCTHPIINHATDNTFDSATDSTAIQEDEISQKKNVISEQWTIKEASLAVQPPVFRKARVSVRARTSAPMVP